MDIEPGVKQMVGWAKARSAVPDVQWPFCRARFALPNLRLPGWLVQVEGLG